MAKFVLASGCMAAIGAATATPALDNPPRLTAAGAPIPVEMLVSEALNHNPEIAAARAESEAAGQRVAPAGAFEDPMFEAGIVNVPLPLSLRREDMTMKMLGLSQKVSFPGKRALRREVAVASRASLGLAVDETVDRVAQDVRIAYEELRLAVTSERLVAETLVTVQQLGPIAEARYSVGQATQSDVLQAQIEVIRLRQQQLKLEQEEQVHRADLRRLLGRHGSDAPDIFPTSARLLALPAPPATLTREAQDARPQLKALDAMIVKSEREVALARREYFPDFEVRFGYGLREPNLQGMPRDDMVTLTVAVNLPLWRKSRLESRVAEATAMLSEATSLLDSKRLETQSMLERALATEHQQREMASLYRSTLMPQTEAAFESALAAYRVGRVDFLTLLSARVRVYEALLGEADAIAEHNKAIAEIDFVTGRAPVPGSLEEQRP